MSSSSLYGRTAVSSTKVIGRVLGLVMLLANSLMTIASSGSSDLFVTHLSNVGTYSGCGAITFGVAVECNLHFWWAHLAASFQVVPLWLYSACCSMNSSTTCLAGSDVWIS